MFAPLVKVFCFTKLNFAFSGCRDEAISGCGLRRRGQPDLLQREHGHAARRRQEDLRRTPD